MFPRRLRSGRDGPLVPPPLAVDGRLPDGGRELGRGRGIHPGPPGTLLMRAPLSSPRLSAAIAAVVIGVAGVAVRAQTTGAFAKDAGIALYAAFVYAIVVVLVPRAAPVIVGAVALALCWGIEFAQLTPVPAALSSHGRLARMIFGTTFHLADLLWYAVGVAVVMGLHALRR
jgi:hypothetical protein